MKVRVILFMSLILFFCVSTVYALDFSGATKLFGVVKAGVTSTAKAARPISDEEEYYIGRGVAARILGTYPLSGNGQLVRYVNLVGRTVALSSDRPSVYGEYHFAVLDTDEVNAFACPGGTILVTRGMIAMTRTEDELAAVLAHEVAHVSKRDGIGAISSSRWTEALTVIGMETAKTYSSSDVTKLAGIFEGTIDDVFKTLVVNGYGKSQEMAADEFALKYLEKGGYNPAALGEFLKHLSDSGRASSGGIMKTHPGTLDRMENISGKMPPYTPRPQSIQTRAARFAAVPK